MPNATPNHHGSTSVPIMLFHAMICIPFMWQATHSNSPICEVQSEATFISEEYGMPLWELPEPIDGSPLFSCLAILQRQWDSNHGSESSIAAPSTALLVAVLMLPSCHACHSRETGVKRFRLMRTMRRRSPRAVDRRGLPLPLFRSTLPSCL